MFNATEIPYDADDEDSSSERESHLEHILAAADYFAPKVDKEADSRYLVKNVFVYEFTIRFRPT